MSQDVIVEVKDLSIHYALQAGFIPRLIGRSIGVVRAVDGVTFELRRGEVLGLVGESGSGKTTLGRGLLGLESATAGSIEFDGHDLVGLKGAELRALRSRMQMVFQDPHASLNPAMDMLAAVGHPLLIHGVCRSAAERRRRVVAVMEQVGLVPVEQFLHKYPSDLSGGQKQRAVIARAVILGPDLLVADEPVSMLDMSVRAKILELLMDLRKELDLTYLYVTHDLATAKLFCDRIAIMYLGRIVEIGSVTEIFSNPRHPYTQALLAAVPEPDPTKSTVRDVPQGEVPDAALPPRGCAFHPRCPVAVERCGWEARDLRHRLERRWSTLGDRVYERERPLVANLDDLEHQGSTVRLAAGRGRNGGDVDDLLQEMQAEDPGDPFWRGVQAISVEPDGVTVDFADAVDPRLRRSGGVDVACVLHDDRPL